MSKHSILNFWNCRLAEVRINSNFTINSLRLEYMKECIQRQAEVRDKNSAVTMKPVGCPQPLLRGPLIRVPYHLSCANDVHNLLCFISSFISLNNSKRQKIPWREAFWIQNLSSRFSFFPNFLQLPCSYLILLYLFSNLPFLSVSKTFKETGLILDEY